MNKLSLLFLLGVLTSPTLVRADIIAVGPTLEILALTVGIIIGLIILITWLIIRAIRKKNVK